MASQYEWHSYCSSIWKYDNQCFWDALWLYYSTCVHNYGGTFARVTNWTLSQVCPVIHHRQSEHVLCLTIVKFDMMSLKTAILNVEWDEKKRRDILLKDFEARLTVMWWLLIWKEGTSSTNVKDFLHDITTNFLRMVTTQLILNE